MVSYYLINYDHTILIIVYRNISLISQPDIYGTGLPAGTWESAVSHSQSSSDFHTNIPIMQIIGHLSDWEVNLLPDGHITLKKSNSFKVQKIVIYL